MLLSTGDIKDNYQVLDLVFASGNSTEGFLKNCQPIDAYQKVAQLLAKTASSIGADGVINIRFDFRVAATQGVFSPNQVFEVYAYGTAVKVGA